MAKRKTVGKVGDIWNWKHGWDDGEHHNYHLLYLQDIPSTEESPRKIRFLIMEIGEHLFLKKDECFFSYDSKGSGYWEEWELHA